MKTNNIKAFSLGLVILLLSLSATIWAADVTPSVTLTSYYSAANGKKADALRTALQGIIDDHTVVGYKSLGTLMQYSDTEEANGKDVVDIYTTCTFTVSGALTWASSGSVGDGMNREHTVPQSWFSEASPMVSDAFHIYPTDCKANNNRSSYLYGEFTGAGTSYSSSKCSESGKLSSTGTKSIASYTVSGKTYTPTATYSGQVYEPADEYKGDIARGYFYMATRYADKCSSWSGGAFGSDNNGFKNYTAELMLKWHRQDPVSRKELIRNEVIYGNSTYNKSSLKQGNRNPFIDYPELVEYIWGDKKDQNVNINDLTSGYAEAGTGTPTSTYNVTLHRMGAVQVLTGKSGTFVLPTDATEANACGDDWKFAGWVTTAVSTATTDKPTFVTQVTGTSTLYAVYAKTESNGSAPRRAKMDASSATYTFTSKSWAATEGNWTSGQDGAGYSNSGVQVTANASGANATCPNSYNNISSIVVSYCTNSSKGAGTIKMTVDGNDVSHDVSTSGGTTARNLTFDFSGSTPTGAPQITVTCTTNSIYICGLTINYSSSGGGGGGSTTYDSDPDDCHCTGSLTQPSVAAVPSDGTITLTWTNDANATNGYTVTIGKGQGYTTECADPEIGAVSLSGSTNTCVITGLVNGLEYTASVVANATATTCESAAGTDSATPIGCESWNVTLGYNTFSLTAGGSKATPTITGTTYGSVTYNSSNEAIITVDEDGKVTPVSAGTATVTAHWNGDATHCPKDVTTNLFTVTGLVRITFDANDGSATPATATQDVTYNVATALTAINTIGFSRTGYTFQGWSTDKNATSAAYTDGASITITAATTLYAVWQVNTHKVTFSPSPTGATVKVNNSSSSPVNNVAYGSTVNIVVTPAAHYSVGSVTANGGVTVTGTGNNWSFTMPDKDVAITVTMVEDTKYTVNWYVSGTPTAETNYAGEALAGIDDPTIDCNDKVFVGWTSHNNHNSDEAPDDLFTSLSGLVMPSNNSTNYYAVFAELTSTTVQATFDAADVTGLTESPSKTWTHDATGIKMQLVGSSSRYTNGTPNTWTMSHASGSKTVITSPTNITQIVVRSVYQYTSGNKTYNGWINDASVGTLSPTTFTSAESDGYVTQTISNINAKSVTIQDNYSSAGNQARVVLLTVTCGSTTYTGYTTSCTAPTQVTVTFNANGGEGTMDNQDVPYNTATALSANKFSRTGYLFAGWATTADGTKVYDDEESVTLTKNLNLFALWEKNNYKVNFTPDMTGQATVTVNGASTSPQSVEFEGTVSIAITPDVAYTVSGVTVSGGVTPSGSGNNWSFTMPANDVTITVTLTAKPTYTIRFLDNSNVISSQTVISGQAATPPSNPAGCEGYAFVGWWTETLASTNTTTHTWITSFTATGNQDYYAVFEHVAGDSGSSSTVSYSASAQSYGNASVPSNKTISGVTFAYAKGDGSNDPKYYDSGTSVRMYANNTLTISASSSISAITFTFGGTTSAGLTASVGTYSSGSWSGSASSITFTAGSSGQQYIQGISVTVGGGGTTYYTTTSECCPNKPLLEFAAATVNKFDGDAPFTITPTVTGNNLNATLSFSSSLPSKASVNETTGEVTIHDAMSNTPVVITATLPAVKDGGNCQAKATASYTLNIYNKVTWLVNGAEYTSGDPTTQVTEGGTLSAYPTDPDGSTVCGGKTFMGWTTAEVDETDTKPTTLYTSLSSMSNVHITQSTTYYAVFAEQTTTGNASSTVASVTFTTASQDASQETSNISTLVDEDEGISSYSGSKVYAGTAGVKLGASSAVGSITLTLSSTVQVSSVTVNASTYGNNNEGQITVTAGSTALGSAQAAATGLTFEASSPVETNTITVATTSSSKRAYIASISVIAGGSITTYSAYTTTCGPNIKAAAVERLTSTKNQTVKSQALTVKGGSLDGNTLTATITGTDAAQFTCALEANTITSGGINTTYTISYTPTVFGVTHEATLTFTDGTTTSDPITLRGRSLPEQFAIVAYDGSKYYVLDGTMTGEAKVVRPIEVTVSGGEVTMCPERAVYYLTQLATPNQNVHLVGQAGRLYGAGSSTGLNTKSLTSTSGTDWLLTTSDFDTYHVTNATSTTRGVMYNETNNAFGHYATSNYGTAHYFGDIRLLPIGTICTCLNAPVATVTPRSTSATITWSAVANAIRYDVTCSGGSVSVSGTMATITGLTGNTTYTYSVKAVALGADCSLSYSDSFTTSSCDDVPQDVRVTPNVTEAIIRWTAEAEQAKVILYSDAECTTPVKTIDPAVSPCTVEDLAEDAHYYVKVFGGADKNCESAVVSFSTLTTAVEIVEWLTDGVKILLTGDDQTASIYIEDKQEQTGGTSSKVAEDIFFSKYFEASGFTKLVGLYNGTDHAIDISDLIIKGGQNGWTETKGANNYIAVGDISKLKNDYGEGDKIMLPKNTEIILYTVRDENKSDYTGEGCVDGFYDWDKLAANTEDNWYRIGKTNSSGSMVDDDGHNQLNFSGPYSIGLFRGSELIDIIGAGTASRPYDTYTVIKNKSKDSELFPFTLGNGRVIEIANDKEGFFCKDGMSPPSEEYPEGYTTYLSTNLCFLMRKNEVVSGANAVDKNKADFVTLCDEWLGVPIGNDLSSAEKSCLSGGQFGYVGSYDYQGYYAQFDSITTITELENHKNDDGTITIPVDRLDTLSCSKLRITVYEGGVEKASKEYQVPIMIASGTKVTTDELFTKHNAETCASCDVVVFNGATLQKGEAASGRNAIHDLTLYPGSTLDLPSGKGDYSVNSVTYRVEGDNVPITSLNGNLMIESETQQLIVTRRITNDRYYFMSLPYDCNVADIRLSNGTPATNGVDFRLLEYDGEARALEGSLVGAPGHWKLVTDDVLEAGKGYAIAVSSKKPKEIVFPMTIPSSNLTYEERTKVTNTVDINEYVGAARNTNHNWNLIAHPYITKFEVASGAANVEAYWEEPHRYNTDWFDDWKTWPEEDPTQGTDSTETHTGEIVESGTTEGGIVWVLYADGSIELTGAGQMSDFTSLDAVPWAQHRQLIQNVKIGGDVQKIGKYAFGQCTNLTNVIIAAPVTNLASQAFAGCTGLRTFRIESAQYVSATTTTFDGISSLTMISLYVPQSMYSQYSAQTPWSKMAISAFDDNSTTGGQTSGDGTNTTNPSPRRAPVHDGWTESPGGIYVTIPVFRGGKVDYDQYWINEVADIKPFTAVFIQGDGQGEMTFNMYPSSPAPKRMLQAAPCETRDHTVFVGLTINGNGQKDKTSLRLRPDFTEEYKFNLDLLKFTVFNTARPQIYFKTPNEQLAFRAVSDSLAANTWLPVGVYCRDAGEYTFALHDRYVWDEVEAVYLRDNVTGAETNLLMGNYTITTTGQIYTNTRFAVKVLLRRKVKDTPTMIDHTEDPNAPRKFFRDGLLYIMRDGKVYDLTGKPVQFDDLLNR